LHRVTGIDISAMNSLVQIRQICKAQQVQLYYVCNVDDMRSKLLELKAVLLDDGGGIFADTDMALEQLEESILANYSDQTAGGSIRDYLEQLIDQPEQITTLLDCLERKTFARGEYLFRQGDVDDGLYVIESGSMSAIIELPDQPAQRLKKFIPGALVGELSAYTDEKTRTASVIANSPTVAYHLDPDRLTDKAILHELIARVIGIRIDYMNRRLMREMI
jgi:hypothetical protein